jgi:hypothetical protein
VLKWTPRQIHAALHHAQIREKKRLADVALANFAGAQGNAKSVDKFVQELTRDG